MYFTFGIFESYCEIKVSYICALKPKIQVFIETPCRYIVSLMMILSNLIYDTRACLGSKGTISVSLKFALQPLQTLQ